MEALPRRGDANPGQHLPAAHARRADRASRDEENLFRKELTAAERTAQEARWVAASKKLSGGNLVTPVSETGEAAESGNPIPILTRARRGRGNKGMAQQVADNLVSGEELDAEVNISRVVSLYFKM